MRAELVLARTTARGFWRDPREGAGGTPKLSNEELMGALAGLPMGPVRLAYVMWRLDGCEFPALERAVMAEAAGLKEIKESDIHEKPGLLRAFCRVAIAEVALPPICKSCRGVGHKGAKECPKCEGSGNASLSVREKAEIASAFRKMSKDTWTRDAKKYGYEAVYAMVERWRARVISHVRWQLSDPDIAVG